MNELESFIFNWINSRFEVETLVTANFFEEGVLDSLSFAELIVVIEDHLKIEINFAEISDWQKVSSIKGLSDFLRPITKL